MSRTVDRLRQVLPTGLTGLAGVACVACCLIPALLAALCSAERGGRSPWRRSRG